MVDTIYLTLKGSIVTRDQLMLIDLLAHFDWKRPIYFTQAISPGELGLRDYLQVDGFVYRLVPIATKGDYLNIGRVDADYLYDKLMNEFSYGNIDDPKVYADYTVHNNFYSTQARTLYARLAKALLEKGDTTRAIEVLDTGIRKIPFSQIRHNYLSTVPIIEAYYMAGAFDKGKRGAGRICEKPGGKHYLLPALYREIQRPDSTGREGKRRIPLRPLSDRGHVRTDRASPADRTVPHRQRNRGR